MKKICLILTGRSQLLAKWIFFCLTITCVPLKADIGAPAMVSLGAGIFDVLRENRRTFQMQVDYIWENSFHDIHPFVSLFFTPKGTFYFCAGAWIDIFLNEKIVISPSFAPGLYFKGKGKDLYFPLEFRSAIALSYRLKNQDRIGIQFYHISNAKLGKKNPGAESLIFFYGISLPAKR
ncbi:MAG: acyloxyacyl hydrolase [Chlamydiae bacterium]|nr:acyloxyacyl hydrolase [Chlamydiota bacterium]